MAEKLTDEERKARRRASYRRWYARNKARLRAEGYFEEKAAYRKAWGAENAEELRAKAKARYEANKEEIAEKEKLRYAANSEERCAKQKERYEENKAAIKSYANDYYAKNREFILARSKRRRRENADNPNCPRKVRVREYMAERRENDPTFKLQKSVRSRLRRALGGGKVSVATEELLGCTVEELRRHLERQFWINMDWSNYGAWHVDHKIPLCAFDLTNPEEFKRASHYTNLQPLWAEDNLAKISEDLKVREVFS